VDHNLNDLTSFIDKHNKYATREAVDRLNYRYQLFPSGESLSAENTSTQAFLKRWFKTRLYNNIPFQFSAVLYFLFRYVLQLGFLDGREGLIYHFLQGFWYRFVVGAKLLELDRKISQIDSTHAKLVELARLTQLKLPDRGKI
jgi:hypothetical protein